MSLFSVIPGAPPAKLHGYKVFNEIDGKLEHVHSEAPFGEVEIGKKIVAPDGVITAGDGTKYPSGFHAFQSRADAEKYAGIVGVKSLVVRRVRLKKVHTIGDQNGMMAIVAKEMEVE